MSSWVQTEPVEFADDLELGPVADELGAPLAVQPLMLLPGGKPRKKRGRKLLGGFEVGCDLITTLCDPKITLACITLASTAYSPLLACLLPAH